MTWISRLLAWWLWKYGPDVGLLKEAARFGTKPKNSAAYSYELARAGFRKSQQRTASGQKLPIPKIPKPSKIVPFKKVGER